VKISQRIQAKRAERYLEKARTLALQARNKIPQNTVRVRQTDVAERMSQADMIRFREAKGLAAHGEILAAARIFEEVKFQRKAIDILEKHGYCDQAAEILLKLKAVNRVAILYERNKQFEKALVYFEKAGLDADAGRVCLVLAKTDCQFYWAAAQHFARSDQLIEAMAAYSQVLAFAEMFELARTKDNVAILLSYLEIQSFTQPLLAVMGDVDLSIIIDSCPATPRYLHAMQKWQHMKPSVVSRRAVLKKIILHDNSTYDFWAKKAPDDRPLYRDSMRALDPIKDRQAILGHVFEIDRIGDGKEALEIFLGLKMNEEAAFLSLKLGLLDAAKALLPALPAQVSTQIGTTIQGLVNLGSVSGTPEFFKLIEAVRPKDWPGPVTPQEPAIDLKLIAPVKLSA
jgi:hypothetical protein